MAGGDPDVFTSDGSINPLWLQYITNKDPAVSEIAAYFLSTNDLNPLTKCCMPECIMLNKTGKSMTPVAFELNPMLLCFFCNRPFHVGCMDLDAHLIKEEPVPWKCLACKSDISNQHCQVFYRQTEYKDNLISRRIKFLKPNVKETNEKFQAELQFSEADLESFDRRATQILMEEDPEVAENTSIITPYVLKRVMKSRADKKRALEVSERFRKELEKANTRIKVAEAISSLQKSSFLHVDNADQSMSFNVPSSSTALHNNPTNRVTNALSNLYTSGNTTAGIELNQSVTDPTVVHNEIPLAHTLNETSNDSAHNNSSQGSVNAADFTTLLQRLTFSQERDERRNLENLRRRALPKIAEFKGEENKWLAFKQDVDRYREHLGRDEVSLKYFVKSALKGEAFEIVRDLFEAESLDVIMATLKVAFGDEMRMVRNRGEELKSFKFNSNLFRMDAIRLQSSIQAYFAACRYANIGYINTNAIAEALFIQFGHEDRLRCRDYYRIKYPEAATIVMDVQTIYDYLLKRIPLLDDAPVKNKSNEQDQNVKSRPYQTYNVSVSTPSNKGDFKFEIKDKTTAPYIGYDLDKVAATIKLCLFCDSSDHYSVQCPRFKEKNENDRLKWIQDKGLCKSCILTTDHRAGECDLKANCGFRVDKSSRCCLKHHISVHGASNGALRQNNATYFNRRRSNTRNNTARVNQRVNNARNAERPPTNNVLETTANASAAFHTLDPREVKLTYNLNVGAITDAVGQNDTPKTVKVFRVKLWGPKGYITAIVIGDSGSEVTLVRNDLREALGIKGFPHTLHLQWADKTSRTCNSRQINMQIQSTEENAMKFDLKNCFALDDLYLPERTLDMNYLRRQFPHLKNIPFEGYRDEYPVMLIGAPHAHLIEGCELVEGDNNGPVAVKTRIGWSVYGGMTHVNQRDVKSIVVNSLSEVTEDLAEDPVDERRVTNEELHNSLVQHFSIESLGVRTTQAYVTEEEKKAIEILDEEVKFVEGSFVEAPLAWNRINKVIPRLPNNYPAALQRQLSEERKLLKNPLHHKAFVDNFKEMLNLEFVRETTEEDINNDWPNIWTLPMSLVVNENKDPPKFRNVYDASAVYKGTSLNNNLLKGPDLLINIVKPLIQMRMNKIAFTADVKAMFNMVKICLRDQQCQRILFRESPDEPMKTYISTVMLFGPTSSPFTSQYIKNKQAEKWMDRYPEGARTLIEYTYMDDVLTSEPSVEKALKVAKQCIEICDAIKWKLVAFQSNSRELLELLPSNAVKLNAIPLLGAESDNHVTKVLGCQWNTTEDCYQFKLENNLFIKLVNDFNERPTKRDQASTLARIYDVLGLISHFTIRGKILLQRSWMDKIDWDEKISDTAVKDWKNWLGQIKDIAELKFPRRFTQLDALSDADDIHLHVFADAGAEAFGTVAYLTVKKGQHVESSLVMAKAKVTPLRMKTETAVKEIPRLELMAALLAARLGKTIKDNINNINLKRSFWCDSEVVLRWILNPNQRLLKYAVGPVEELLELTERSEWKYVPTELNVADLCTKMKKADFSCNDSVWMIGPDFIKLDAEQWPKMPEKLLTGESFMANNIYLEKLRYATHTLPPLDCPIANDKAIDKLSASIKAKWTKLTRATARALKLHMDLFIPVIRTKQLNNMAILRELKNLTNNVELVQSIDIERAEHFIFRKIQHEEFTAEYKALKEGKPVRNPTMQQLNVFMDPQGIIRINARTNVNKESHPQQFVPLLPRKNVFVTNLLAYYHYKYEHIATETQIADLRSKVWIPQLRTALRSVKSRCNWCRIKKALPFSPKMAPLPDDRVNATLKPFEVTGIDVIGPLRPTVNGNVKKVYILIFVCTLTRYIHLHILDSMESLRVLEAIVTFWTAYGPVRKFVSDNASNFKRTAKTLEEDYQREKVFNTQLATLGPKLSEVFRVEWQFIPVHAPWFGAVYERLIKEVKRMLASTLEKRKINRVELNIAVQEAAHRINCRPLTENPIDAADSEILTPHHLVKNKSGWPLLPGIHKNVYSTVPDRSIYRRGRAVANEMLQKFTSRYLPELTRRTKWHKTDVVAKVGDLVLVIEPNQTRREWKRGKIIKVHMGKDGTVRVADVKMANGVIKKNRAVRNLAKLSLTNSLHEEKEEILAEKDLTVVKNSNFNVSCTFKLQVPLSCKVRNFDLFKSKHFGWQKHENKLNSFTMKRQELFKSNNAYVLQADGVTKTMRLSSIVSAIEPEIKSIIGIARARDYKNNINTNSVYIFLLDHDEYAKLMVKHRSTKLKDGISVSFPDLIIGNARIVGSIETVNERTIDRSPKALALFKLPAMRFNTSGFVANIIKTFEDLTEVTGFRWCVSESRPVTRSFGFLLLPSRDHAVRLAGRQYIAADAGILLEAELTNSVPILLHHSNYEYVNDRNKAVLTDLMMDINLLHRDEVPATPERPNLAITIHQRPHLNVDGYRVVTFSEDHTSIQPTSSTKSFNLSVTFRTGFNAARPAEVIVATSKQPNVHVLDSAQSITGVVKPKELAEALNAQAIDSTDVNVPKDSQIPPADSIAKSTAAALPVSLTPMADDTVQLTLNEDERFEEEPPCCSKNLQLDSAPHELREQATVKIEEGHKKKKVKSSNFVRLKFIQRYLFKTFGRKVMQYIRRHKHILFMENSYGSVAYIEFEEEKDAVKFKKIVDGLKEDNECSVHLSDLSVKRKIEKAIDKSLKPFVQDQIFYLVDNALDVTQCNFGGEWGRLTFAPPEHVAN